jgi:hypothetical protein
VLLAVTALPAPVAQLDGAALRQAAAAIGLAAADVRMRLSGLLPRVLLSDREGDELAEAAAALNRLGFATIICDPALAPTDDERIVGRRVEITGERLRVWDGADACHECQRADVALIQRGVRATVERRTVTTTQSRLDPARAILSGGLILTKKTTQSQTLTNETRDAFLLIQRADGAGDLMLYERRLDYRFLGPEMQPSSHPNFERLVARVRLFCPAVPVDDRVARPGFVGGLPSTTSDPTDLALYLITLAARVG